ncbi:MAG: putative Co/Zn/Cd efflux system rane fusion protein [Evtepia sp.]|nr:putative Co/Zn/Cd efflux system rane fusion protein [Evtepia sp.]
MKKACLIAGILALSLLALSGCGNKEEQEEKENTGVPVEVQTVSRGTISTENHISGSVVADKTETVYVSLSARCTNVPVKVGDIVRAGDTICTLDLKSFSDNYELAELSYKNAQQSYQDQSVLLDQQIAQAEKSYRNTLSLLEIGAASQLEVDNAKLALDGAKVNRTSALAQLELAMKNAQKTMDQVTDTLKNVDGNGNIKAPISGTVVSLSVGKDSFVSAGMPVAVIDSISDMKVSVAVSETLISKIQTGDKASVTIRALNQTFEGMIQDISKAANPTNHLYTVKISIPEGITGILSGMFADVTLYTDSRENTVVIPTEAILVKEDGQYVVVLNDDQTARRVSVQVGLIGAGVTEVTSGLSGGENLVTVGQSYLADGDLARVVPAEE